jgi:hypothetical protein
MHLKKKLVVLALAAIGAASLAAAPSASAAANVECAFTGLAGNITPGVPAILGPNGPLGGAGTYTFEGEATCSGVDAAGNAVTPSPNNTTIKSSGAFTNTACGTGTAIGNAATRAVGAPPPGTYVDFHQAGIQDITQVSYSIQFVGGNGALTVTKANNKAANGGGEVTIIPHDGDCVLNDVRSFDVAGGFSVTQ